MASPPLDDLDSISPSRSESKAAPKSPSRPEAKSSHKSHSRSESTAAPRSPSRPEAKSAPKSHPKSEPRSEPGAGPRPDSAPEPEAKKDPSAAAKAQEAKKLLEELLSWLSEQATVQVREESRERIRLEILGDKTGLLIGKRGQTLDALQFLINKMVNRTAENSRRIEVDMEQYRKRREQSLRSMATRLGEKVKKKKKPITIEAMNAHDRRIIHLTLKSDPSLETRSVGKGEMRKLVIHLANNGRSKGHERSGASS